MMKTHRNAQFHISAFGYSRVHNHPFLQPSWYIATKHTHNGYIVQMRNANMLRRHPKVGSLC